MYCTHCGGSIPDDSTFCIQCGRQVQVGARTLSTGAGQVAGSARTSAEDGRRRRLIACLVVSLLTMLIFHDLAGLFAVGFIILFFYFGQVRFPVPYKLGAMGALFAITLILQLLYIHNTPNLDSGDQIQPATAAAARQTENVIPISIPPPKFRVFKLKTDEPTAYVVPVSTTDDQLKSLLWLFRQKVRTGQFSDIGITRATAKQWGEYGYKSGMLVIYRGEKCANEGYVSLTQAEKGNLGPCGYGEHDDAYYQWGISADPDKDEGGIMDKDRNTVVVFDFKDNWQPSPRQ